MYSYQWYNLDMTKRHARPPKAHRLDDYLEIRVQALEKQTFKEAAELAGIPMAAWIRERLRLVAIRELGAAGRAIPFLQQSGSEP